MAGKRELWVVYSELDGKDEHGQWQYANYGYGGPRKKPPKDPPAGGTLERSGDGNWISVYRPDKETGTQLLVRVLMKVGERPTG